jgi:hypothetical protein
MQREITYAVESEAYYASEGRHYEYYTDAVCEVVSVSDSEVYVFYKGNVYSFYTDGTTECKPNQKWHVVFNEAMEIVSVY